jgi:hypothetical protein
MGKTLEQLSLTHNLHSYFLIRLPALNKNGDTVTRHMIKSGQKIVPVPVLVTFMELIFFENINALGVELFGLQNYINFLKI